MVLKTIQFLLQHPISSRNKPQAFHRFVSWQLGSRLLRMPVVFDFVNESRLLINRSMTGATGNLYAGLHEFEDMAFVLHALRQDDVFVDIGANIGSYTILAGVAVGAKCIAVEPIPTTFKHLLDNVNLNNARDRIECFNIGIGSRAGNLLFSSSQDTTNHVLASHEEKANSINVPVKTLDSLLDGRHPRIIKIDVEGWETEVIAGADRTLSIDAPLAIILELGGSRYGFKPEKLHPQLLNYGFTTAFYKPFERKLIALEDKINTSGNTLYVKNMDYFRERLLSAPQYRVLNLNI
jgi:FkbM family methyltransferase